MGARRRGAIGLRLGRRKHPTNTRPTPTEGQHPTAAPPCSLTSAKRAQPACSPSRTPGSRWRPRPGCDRARGARCPGQRCCSWSHCCPSPPRRGHQVRAAPGSVVRPPLRASFFSSSPATRLLGRPDLRWMPAAPLTCEASWLKGPVREGRWGPRAPEVPAYEADLVSRARIPRLGAPGVQPSPHWNPATS